jgi:transcriptional regulator with XRE-family HTH domain
MASKNVPDRTDQPYVPIKPGTPLTFGSLLRHIRKQRGMTLAQVSDASGIDQATISKIELGDRLPPEVHTLVRISTALEIPEGSEGFKDLLALALDERGEASETSGKTQGVSTVLNLTRPMDLAEGMPVLVNDLAELLAKSTAYAITNGAISITVRASDGSVQRFQVLAEQKSTKGGKRISTGRTTRE